MARSRRTVGAAGSVLLLVLAVGCGDDEDGGGGPMEPEPLDVNGIWVETIETTLDGCGLLPEVSTETRVLTQDGTDLVADVMGLMIEGTIDPATGDFTLELDAGNAFVIQSGRFTSNDRYSATTTATLANGCRFETDDEGVRQGS